MKRLLQISADSNCYSVGKIMEDIGRVAIQNGWESYVAYGRDYRPSDSHVFKIGNILNVYEHAIESRLFDNHGLSSRVATYKFVKQIELINPDVIQLHCIHGYYINYQILFCCLKKLNKPIFWTLHDCWPFTGHCSYPTFINCDKFKLDCKNCGHKDEYPKSALMSRADRNLINKKESFLRVNHMTLIPVSYWLDGIVKESFLGAYQSEVIYNGVDLKVFKPSQSYVVKDEILRKYNIHKDHFLLGVASTWDERKGLDDYISLRKILRKEIDIVLVGINDAQRKALPEGIIGIPKTSNQTELAHLYSFADVLLNLSSAETFGMTTAEGFACGTPCVGYNATATPELISSDTGFIVEKGDIQDLCSKIETVMEKGRSAYSVACRKRATDNFDKDKCFQRYIDLYNSALKIND